MNSAQSLKVGDFLNAHFACPICLKHERRVVSLIGRKRQALTTVICTSCGLVHSHPMPTRAELDAFYHRDYRVSYKSSFTPKLKHTLRYAPGAKQRVSDLLKHADDHQRTLLDIGSGSGEFLFMALQQGFKAEGIEPNAGYAEYTRTALHLPVEHTTLENAGFAPESYDIISLNHVLEHMPEPFDTLTRIHALLKPNGLLSIAVPDIAALSHAPQTRFHYAHVFNYNHATLKALLTKAGFDVVTECQGTSLIAKKQGVPNFEQIIEMTDNYELLWTQLVTQTPIKHYATAKPYRRLVKKAHQYAREWYVLRSHSDAKSILAALA